MRAKDFCNFAWRSDNFDILEDNLVTLASLLSPEVLETTLPFLVISPTCKQLKRCCVIFLPAVFYNTNLNNNKILICNATTFHNSVSS